MKRERRSATVTAAEVGEHPHGGFIARVLRYGLPADDYGTSWERGVANAALEKRLPVLAWGHSWTEPLGRAVRWWEEDDGLYMEFAFDDPDAVPRARQARAQIESGTLKDMSIGFVREASKPNDDGTVAITKASIDEVSIVLRGAVSGSHVLAVRSGATVSAEVAAQLAAQLIAGDIDAAEFFASLKDAAATPDPAAETPAVEEEEPEVEPEVDGLDSMMDEALGVALGRSAR
jgi:HK97 family phage prohead protease